MTHVKLLHQLLHFCTSYCISVFTLKLRVVDKKAIATPATKSKYETL